MENRAARHAPFAAPIAAAAFLSVVTARSAQALEYEEPNLSINIPLIQFSQVAPVPGDETKLNIPYIAEYVSGLYAYLILIAGVVAGIMMVIGGFQYLTAGGDAGRVKAAKERITNAIAGVILTLGAYTLLGLVSPSFVELKGLQVSTIENVAGPSFDEPGGVPEIQTHAESSAYDETFKKYAACAGLDWRVLKAIAKKESGFREAEVNDFGFVGLFQVGPQFCSLGDYGRGDECTTEGLKNPDANTAAAAGGQLKTGAAILKRKCPQLKQVDQFVMLLYYGHNSGPGALNAVLDDVKCSATPEEYFAASSRFWAAKAARTGKNIPNQNGRMQYSQKVANQAIAYGVTDPFSSAGSGTCPLK